MSSQISRAVLVSPGERSIEVRLDPPHLGRVRIDFDFSGDVVKAVVSASDPEALSLLRRGHAGLARDLGEMGFGETDIEYSEDRSSDPDTAAPGSFVLSADPAFSKTGEQDAGPAVRIIRHDGLLDLTL